MTAPKGFRNISCLPIQYTLTRKANARKSVMGRSMFEVCGAAMMTYFGTSGRLPSFFQPMIFNERMDIQ